MAYYFSDLWAKVDSTGMSIMILIPCLIYAMGKDWIL